MIRLWCISLVLLLTACDPVSSPTPFENYQDARATFWRELYPVEGETLYCRSKFKTAARNGFNVEHVFPMSWATNGLKCGKRKQCRASSQAFNRIEGDLHNLFPAREEVNKANTPQSNHYNLRPPRRT
jgi:deoxyribonuclease-1